MLKHRLVAVAAAAALVSGVCAPVTAMAQTAPAAQPVVAAGDLVETARASGQFGTLLKALAATNLTQLVKTNNNLTLFAPTDQAFAALPAGELDRLMADKPALQKLLTHHLVNAPLESASFKGAKGPVPSVAGDTILLDGSEEALKADGATIVQADIKAANGILHVVDKVLLGAPPAAEAGNQAQD